MRGLLDLRARSAGDSEGRRPTTGGSKVGKAFLQSRVARRIFGLFILCAVVPLTGLAYLSFSVITEHLEELSRKRLQESAKAVGMTLLDRLNVLEADTEFLTGRVALPTGHASGPIDDLWRQRLLARFSGIAFLAEDGSALESLGAVPRLPVLNVPQQSRLRRGEPILVSSPGSARGAPIWLVRPLAHRAGRDGRLYAMIRPEYLWGNDLLVSSGTDLLVLGEGGEILAATGSDPGPAVREAALVPEARSLRGGDRDRAFLGGRWTLFLTPRFGTRWTLLQIQSRASAMAPLHRFQTLFALTACLTLLVVLLLSITQIRRSMVPLEVLHGATRSIEAGEFETRASVHGRDEFSDLAYSFNRMAGSIQEHLRKLEALYRIGVALSAEKEVNRLLGTILRGAQGLTGADSASLYTVAPDGRHLQLSLWLVNSLGLECDGPSREVPLYLPSGEPNLQVLEARVALQDKAIAVPDAHQGGEFDFTALHRLEAPHGYCSRSLLTVPLKNQDGETLGVLQLANASGPGGDSKPFPPLEQRWAESLASQAAVALTQGRLTAALRESESRYRDLVNNSPGPIWIHDAEGRLRFVNPACARGFGCDPQEIAGRNLKEFLVRDASEPLQKYLSDLRQSRTAEAVLRVASKAGEERVWVVRSLRYEGPDGQPFVIAHGHDVTERDKIEARLRQTQKLQAIGTLAGGIAHDFNNILTPLLGYTELALDETLPGDSVRMKLERVLSAAERARDLVRQILTFSREGEEGRVSIALPPLVKEVLKLIRASLPSTVEIRVDVDSLPGLVLADPAHLHQVLMNLCTNAAYALGESEGLLEVRLEAAEISSDFAAAHPGLGPGAHARLTVRDTGCGMPPEVAERAFEPFFTTKPPGQGTGLGLATVHGIVTELGGTVSLSSVPGQGTMVEIYLPLTQEEPHSPGEQEEPPRGRGERILFVEDEPEIARVARTMLEQLGYEALTVPDGAEALSTIRREPGRFDLLVTEQSVRGLPVRELAREVRRIRPDLPIVLCSGRGGAPAAGTEPLVLSSCLSKPFRLREVAAVLSDLLTRPPGTA